MRNTVQVFVEWVSKCAWNPQLEQEFAFDLGDYDAYRYFNPPIFDVFIKRRGKGRGDKIPLTIGMLYLAIKTHSWDTQTLENLS